MNIRIAVAPESGISYTYHGCLGLYDGNYGDVEGTFDDDGDGIPDGLKINWALQVGNNFDFCSKKCYFVRWAAAPGSPGRFYLVPESKMVEVVKNYNMGGQAQDYMFGTPRKYDEHESERNPDTGPRVEGVPRLPPRWASQLVTGDWVARVIAIAPATIGSAAIGVYATEARVTLDKGRADGIYLGMEIPVGSKAPDAGRLTIDAVNQHTAEGVFRILAHDDQKAALPVVGQAIWIFRSGDNLRRTNSP